MEMPQIFESKEFGKIRVVERSGAPWFVGKDVCDCLEIGNSRDAAASLDDDEKGVALIDTPGGKQEMSIISEPGLYSLVLRSRKPEAKAFKRWIVHEVLPAIRKHGGYLTPKKLEEALLNPDVLIRLATQLKEEREARVQAEARVATLSHVRKTYTTTEIAKELGMRSAVALNRLLCRRRVNSSRTEPMSCTPRVCRAWLLFIKPEILESDKIVCHRRWTQLGRNGSWTSRLKKVPAQTCGGTFSYVDHEPSSDP